MRCRLAATAALIVAIQVASAAPASADDAPVLVADNDKVVLSSADDGEATASVTLENQANTDVQVSAVLGAGAAKGCKIRPPDDSTLKRHQQKKMTFTLAAACDPTRKKGTDFTVTAGASTFDLHANPPKTADPDWIAVGAGYGIVALIALILLFGTYLNWDVPPERAGEKSMTMTLPGLEASWKFTDSWAANATVITALFTGIFGAKEVTAALLGDDATNLVAVGLVSAAISVGLAGVSPMVLQGCRRRIPKIEATADTAEVPAGLYVTPRGLVLAALFTLAGTGGQLANILWALSKTDFWADWVIAVLGLVAAVLLTWYAVTATSQNLTTGATLPPPKKVDTVPAPTIIKLPAEQAHFDFAAENVRAITIFTPPAREPVATSVGPRPAGIL